MRDSSRIGRFEGLVRGMEMILRESGEGRRHVSDELYVLRGRVGRPCPGRFVFIVWIPTEPSWLPVDGTPAPPGGKLGDSKTIIATFAVVL